MAKAKRKPPRIQENPVVGVRMSPAVIARLKIEADAMGMTVPGLIRMKATLSVKELL